MRPPPPWKRIRFFSDKEILDWARPLCPPFGFYTPTFYDCSPKHCKFILCAPGDIANVIWFLVTNQQNKDNHSQSQVNNSSTNMEPAAARASIAFLQDAGLDIKVFVTDRSLPLAISSFDLDMSQIAIKHTFCTENKLYWMIFKGPSLLGQSWKRNFRTFCTRSARHALSKGRPSAQKLMFFFKSSEGGGGHFWSKKLHCRFCWF